MTQPVPSRQHQYTLDAPTWYRPVIGIPFSAGPRAKLFAPVWTAYAQVIEQAGGTPLWLPPVADVAVFAPLWMWLAGVLLPGGTDVHPYAYGEDVHPLLGTVDPEADRLELWLAEEAIERNLPILGVNRGMQVLNVALGGSLFQDLAAQLGTWLHMKVGQPRCAPAHPVNVVSGTRLADLMGTEPAMVNSWHHQGIKGLGQGVAIAALAPDDVIEAIELPTRRFALGLQWAIEALMLAGDGQMQRIFAGFIEAARAYGIERHRRLLLARASLDQWERQWVRDLAAYTQGRARLFGDAPLGDLEALELRQRLPVLKGRLQAVTEALGLPDPTPPAGRL